MFFSFEMSSSEGSRHTEILTRAGERLGGRSSLTLHFLFVCFFFSLQSRETNCLYCGTVYCKGLERQKYEISSIINKAHSVGLPEIAR